MSGFYIHGMEMPTFRDDYVAIVIYGNGTIRSVHGYVIDGATAVSVPPHGRLIDADALKKNAYPFPCAIGTEWAVTLRQINDAPTIIPAEEGE